MYMAKKKLHRNEAYTRRLWFRLHSGKVRVQKFCLAWRAVPCSCNKEGEH